MALLRSKSGKASRLFEKTLDETAQHAADTCATSQRAVDASTRLVRRTEETVAESKRRIASIREARERCKQQRSG